MPFANHSENIAFENDFMKIIFKCLRLICLSSFTRPSSGHTGKQVVNEPGNIKILIDTVQMTKNVYLG